MLKPEKQTCIFWEEPFEEDGRPEYQIKCFAVLDPATDEWEIEHIEANGEETTTAELAPNLLKYDRTTKRERPMTEDELISKIIYELNNPI